MVATVSAWLSRELARLSAARVWGVAFVTALSAGLLIQLFILPVLLPSYHSGHGILAANDALSFHKAAVTMAQEIGQEGWGAWVLAPGGVAPIGIMAAAYVFLPCEPYVILPLYAAVFAVGAASLFAALRLCGFSRKAAGSGVLGLLLLPSGTMIYAIPHKDVFFVGGNLLFVYALLRLAMVSETGGPEPRFSLCGSFLLGIWGASLVWLVRPYGIEVMLGAGGLVALTATLSSVSDLLRRRPVPIGWPGRLLVLWLLVVLLKPWGDGQFSFGTAGDWSLGESEQPLAPAVSGPASVAPAVSGPASVAPAASGPASVAPAASVPTPAAPAISPTGWQFSGFLPLFLENKVERLAATRTGWANEHAASASAIDLTVRFVSVREMVGYLPRAAQIGLFAPFPADWFQEGAQVTSKFMRRLSSVEMTLWYLLFPFALLAPFLGRRRLGLALLGIYAFSSILVFVVAIPNVGTLYRIRYGPWMLLFSSGVAMAVTMAEEWRRQRERAANPHRDSGGTPDGPVGPPCAA